MLTGRVRSLDGLRGLAALVVVVHHSSMVSPSVAEASVGGPASGWVWAATHTPVRLLWSGGEAVVVFFVLSGFVLTLPFLTTDGRPSWRSYYAQRLVRLYVPVAAAVGIALGLLWLVPRTPVPGLSWWMASHPPSIPVTWLVRDLVLVSGASWLDGPLWSLQWEVWFSILLPLYLVVAVRFPGLRALLLAGAVGCVAAGDLTGFRPAQYLPMFAVGVLMATERDRMVRIGATLSTRHWWAVIVASLVVTVPSAFALPALPASHAMTCVGAALLVWCCIACPTVERVFSARLMVVLGAVSFSLYLLHEPIVVTLDFMIDSRDFRPGLLLGAPLALLAAWAFHHGVERPAHRLARRAGRAGAGPARPPTSGSGPESP